MRRTKTRVSARFRLLADGSVRAGAGAVVAFCFALALAPAAQSQSGGKGLKRSDACSIVQARVFTDDKARALLKEIQQQQKATAEKASRKTQLQAYKEILRQTFAYDTVARSLIGPYWRKMSPSQREEYALLISSILESTVSNAIYNLSVVDYELSKVSRLGKDFAVSIAVSVEDENEALPVVWRVRCFDNGGGTTRMGIIDVIFRNVSVIAGKRREMTDIVSKQGVGQFLRLLALERDRLRAQEK